MWLLMPKLDRQRMPIECTDGVIEKPDRFTVNFI